MLAPSPRCILNCQALSIHLPPLPEPRGHSLSSNHLSLSMSASSKYSRSVNYPPQKSSYHRHYSISPESGGSSSSKPTTAQSSESQDIQSPPQHLQREASTPASSADIETTGKSLQVNSDSHFLQSESKNERSSYKLDSPDARNLVVGAPGASRKVKAHVPSACVNCKRKHLACETKRPCGRCVQTGKEVSSPARKPFVFTYQSTVNLRGR